MTTVQFLVFIADALCPSGYSFTWLTRIFLAMGRNVFALFLFSVTCSDKCEESNSSMIRAGLLRLLDFSKYLHLKGLLILIISYLKFIPSVLVSACMSKRINLVRNVSEISKLNGAKMVWR